MKYNLKSDYNFSENNLSTPDLVIQDICNEFAEITDGLVKCNVREYAGIIDSYEQISPITAMTTRIGGTTKVDVQDKLGAIGDKLNFQFELSLSAKLIENYKYRILFISYGTGGYPVKVVLEQQVADEINKKNNSDYIFIIDTKEDFEKFIVAVLNSQTIVDIVQELIIASQRKMILQKDKKKDA